MKRSSIVLFLSIVLVAGLSAQRTWEGTASVGRYGEFPPTGFYGASNSFARNSIVDVTNLDTGKSIRLIVTGGLGDPALFLVVSEQAAESLGMSRNDIGRVRVSPVVVPGSEPVAANGDLPYSTDPEINPAARAGDPNQILQPQKSSAVSAPSAAAAVSPAPSAPAVPSAAAPKANASSSPAKSLSSAPAEAPALSAAPAEMKAAPALSAAPAEAPAQSAAPAEAPAQSAAPAEKQAAQAPAVVTAPKAPEVSPVSPVLSSDEKVEWAQPLPENPIEQAKISVKSREKNLFPPSRDSESFAIASAAPVPEKPKAQVKPEPFEGPSPDLRAIRPPAADIGKTVTIAPEAKVEAEAEADKPVPSEIVAALEPADLKPPVQSKETVQKLDTIIASIEETPADTPAETSAENLPLISSLARNSYYLQIGSYSNQKSLKRLVDELGTVYPIAVMPVEGEKNSFGFLSVPVGVDEKGAGSSSVQGKGL